MAENQATVNVPSAEEVKGAVSKVTEKITSVGENVGSTLKEGLSKGSSAIGALTGKFGMMVLIGVIVAVILLGLAYFLYMYISSRLSNKLFYTVPDSETPRKGTEYTRLDGGGLPTSTNGNRATFMFWIYIHDINKFSGEGFRHVLHRGDEATVGASPIVYLDGARNKLYIRFDKTGTNISPSDFVTRVNQLMDVNRDVNPNVAGVQRENPDVKNADDAIKVELSTNGIIVDYVPLQRWVHVAVVVNETVNRGYISVYLDGEIVKSVSSEDRLTLSNGSKVACKFQNLQLSKKGDIYVGGNIYNDNVSKGFSGIVSRISFSNYDMNGNEIRNIYLQGPLDNLTSKLGLPAYGVRSPIYRIG